MFKLAPEKDKNTKEKNYISKTKTERKWRISVLQIKFENPWQNTLTRVALPTRGSVSRITGEYNGKCYSEMVSNGYNVINNGIFYIQDTRLERNKSN